MPRRNHHPDGNFFRGKGHSYLAAEEALGIGLFILVLAILLIFGCWYYKRRSGYKSLRVSMATHFLACYYFDNVLSVGTIRTVVGEGTILDCKTALQEYRNFNSVVPDAPPAYEKIAADQSPPPYSP
ncbi:Melanoma antigen recognized by T-cells 1 [Fulmarus glacialis]|uniref:Melanoma antigen recognized by T-cells 1 n=1 Tax=Fulmarus glacialis TaxID=30455 RepID=A0A093KN60_FULGA|nr:Melanoma antigen recognized by T-cells 1 [Fulmarus glacialis]